MIRLRFSDLRGAHPDWIIRTGAHAISWWTRSPWNHVDAISDRGGAAYYGAMPGDGVAWRRTVPARAELIVDVECTADQSDAFWNAVNAQHGKGYDYKAVVGWSAGLQDESVWFCSELIALGLIKAGLMDGQKHVSPADLYARFWRSATDRP
jgi:hypothetical protein